ncbi:NAD-dependent epimerase/dehydratase family protein [candidate division CSSED10-310 bacterium]|uniref:NAD-dependent epimerase/dehydratase family protein n=1 Tax=candidate division CSSED10-310 bacterium TaxID=2855610 RepID=A0ABV6YSJ2_UNCC1
MEKDYTEFFHHKRVLITGGLGFLGSTLALKLVACGAQVTLLDGLIEDLGANFFNIEPIKDEVEIVIAHLSDRAATDYHVQDKDLIFNIGMHSSHLDSMKRPLYDLETNIIPQLQFLESIRYNNPEAMVLYVGSRAQFGKVKKFPINENTPLAPADIYAAGKQLVEYYHFLYQDICGLRPISLRLGNTYGPRHQMKHAKYGVQNYLIRLALDGEQIQVFGEGQQLREMIFVDDVIDALLLLVMNEQTIGHYYCIGVDEKISFLELVKTIISVCGNGSYQHVPWPEERKVIEVGDVQTDFSKLSNLTDWKPTTPLREGLRRTADFYKQYKSYYW